MAAAQLEVRRGAMVEVKVEMTGGSVDVATLEVKAVPEVSSVAVTEERVVTARMITTRIRAQEMPLFYSEAGRQRIRPSRVKNILRSTFSSTIQEMMIAQSKSAST